MGRRVRTDFFTTANKTPAPCINSDPVSSLVMTGLFL